MGKKTEKENGHGQRTADNEKFWSLKHNNANSNYENSCAIYAIYDMLC